MNGTPLLQGAISAAEEEEVLPGELREAWFTILPAAHKGVPRPGPFYGRCAAGFRLLLCQGARQASGWCSVKVRGRLQAVALSRCPSSDARSVPTKSSLQ